MCVKITCRTVGHIERSFMQNDGMEVMDTRDAGNVDQEDEQEKNLRPIARVDNLEEIGRRRNEANARLLKLRNYTEGMAFKPLPDHLKNQPYAYMLILMTGRGHQRPASPYPGICLLGCFEGDDREMLLRQIKDYAVRVIHPKFRECDIRLVPMDEWRIIASTLDLLDNDEYCQNRIKENVDLYYTHLRSNQRNFVKKVEEVTGKKMTNETDPTATSTTAPVEKLKKNKRKKLATIQEDADGMGVEREILDNDDTTTKETAPPDVHSKLNSKLKEAQTARLPVAVKKKVDGDAQLELLGLNKHKDTKVSARESMRRNQVRTMHGDKDLVPPYPNELIPRRQSVAAVCFMRDMRPEAHKCKVDKEPMFRILQTYESTVEAQAHVKEHLAPYMADFDVDVVSMGEWLFPEDLGDKEDGIETVFRDKTQNEIMQRRKEEKKQVSKYEKACQEQGVEPSELFLKQAEEGITMEELYEQMTIKGDVLSPGLISQNGKPVKNEETSITDTLKE